MLCFQINPNQSSSQFARQPELASGPSRKLADAPSSLRVVSLPLGAIVVGLAHISEPVSGVLMNHSWGGKEEQPGYVTFANL